MRKSNISMWTGDFIWCLLLVSVKSKLYFKLDDNNANTFLSDKDSSDVNITNITLWDVCRTTFFMPHTYISIVSIDNDYLDSEEVFKKFGLTEWHTKIESISTSCAAIIVVRSPADLYRLFEFESSLTNQKYVFVIVVLECSETITIEMMNLWSSYYIYKYVIICGRTNPVLYIFRPFVSQNKPNIVEVSELSEISHNIVHATDNLYGSVLNVVLFPLMPYTIMSDGKYVGGIDFLVLETLQEAMNFTPVLFRPSDGKTYGVVGKNISGSMRDVILGKADIAFNGHFLMDYKNDEIMLTRSIHMDKMCFIVPMPSYKTHYAVVIHIFSTYVWCLIFVMYFSIIILYYVIEKITNPKNRRYSIQDLFLQSYTLTTLGITTIQADNVSKKFLLGSVLITVLILSNSFQGSLVTVLSRPMRSPYINTLEDLAESNLALQSRRAESLLSDPEGAQLVNTLRQKKLTNRNYVRLGRFPIMTIRLYRNYLYYRKNVTENLHAVPECIATYNLAYVVPKNSPYLAKIDKLLIQLFENGLQVNWFGTRMMFLMRNICWPLDNESFTQTEAKTFSMADLGFAFVFLIFGLVLSSVVFLIEILLGDKKKISNKN